MKSVILLLMIILLAGCQSDPSADPKQGSGEHAQEQSEQGGHGDHDEESGGHNEHGDESEGFVEPTEAQKAELGFKTVPVVAKAGQNTGVRPGRIEADPDNRVVLSSQVSGTLERFYAQVGARVRKGQLVAVISSPEVTVLQAAHHEADVEMELARKELINKRSLVRLDDNFQRPTERAKLELAQAKSQRDAVAARLESAVLKNERLETLLKEGIASKQQVDQSRADRKALEAELQQAKAAVEIAKTHLKRESRVAKSNLRVKAETLPAEASLARATEQMQHAKGRLKQLGANLHGHDGIVNLYSPIDGIVVERPLTRGEMVAPGTSVAVIVDSSRVWVWVDLQRRDLALIDEGDPVELSLVNKPEIVEKGFIDYIAPTVDQQTQTVKVRIVLTNPGEEFRLGSFVNARVSSGETKQFPAVPEKSVQFVEGKTVVYIQKDGGFQRTEVKLGSPVGDGLVVAEGLEIGSKVVVTGVEQLKSLDLSGTIGGHSH